MEQQLNGVVERFSSSIRSCNLTQCYISSSCCRLSFTSWVSFMRRTGRRPPSSAAAGTAPARTSAFRWFAQKTPWGQQCMRQLRLRAELTSLHRCLSLSVCLCAEERHLLLPGVRLVPGAGQVSGQQVLLQPDHQPTRWLQYVQVAASGGVQLLITTLLSVNVDSVSVHVSWLTQAWSLVECTYLLDYHDLFFWPTLITHFFVCWDKCPTHRAYESLKEISWSGSYSSRKRNASSKKKEKSLLLKDKQ